MNFRAFAPRHAVVALILIASCSRATPAPAPAPAPAPRAPERAAKRDTAVARPVERPAPPVVVTRPREVPPPAAIRPSAAPHAPVRMAAHVPKSRVPVASVSARNDTIATHPLHGPVRVCAGGDVTLGTNLFPEWSHVAEQRLQAKYGLSSDPEALLSPLRPLVSTSDVLLLNVESAIGAGDTPSKCGPRSTNCFAFRSPPSAAPALRALSPRVVVGNLANNHARDAGNAGVDSSVAALGRAGVLVTGVDTMATPVRTVAGDTIGVLGFYTSNETPDARDTAAVFRHVSRAAQRYPVVIVTMHLGAEGRTAQRTLDQRELFLRIDRGNPVAFADAAVRGGAALVIGHGPHVLRAMEWREGGALIAYSLGNLLTYGPFVLKEPLNRGAVLCATVGANGRVRSASLTPTMQRAPGVLQRDEESRAVILVDSLSRLDFPATGVRGQPDGALRPRHSLARDQ